MDPHPSPGGSPAFDDLAREAMRAAVDAARRGDPSPNPHVGAVVVRDGAVVATGWHRRVGDDHAEVMALAAAGDRARGATVYVTLEPCNHHGRTPPCTEALARAGVSRVVFAVGDPNPHVAGGGRAALRAGGVEVTEGFDPESQAAAERLIAPWRTYILHGRAHVTLKAAMTLDARIATRTGESRWITGEAARRDGHALRAASDAVLVGSRTVLADDPTLTARLVPTPRQPVRVVVDSKLTIPLSAQVVQTAREVATWVLTVEAADLARAEALRACGVLVLPVGGGDGRVDLAGALRALASRGIVAVLCEGGGGLHGALLDAGLADRVVCYIAPTLFGGNEATPAFGGRGVGTLATAHRLVGMRTECVGQDLRIEAELTDDVHRDHPGGR